VAPSDDCSCPAWQTVGEPDFGGLKDEARGGYHISWRRER
jgi:hypothetical protein